MIQEELLKEIMEDPGNQLFGLPLRFIRRMISEYQIAGVNPYKMVELEARIRELEEYKAMYEGLCK